MSFGQLLNWQFCFQRMAEISLRSVFFLSPILFTATSKNKNFGFRSQRRSNFLEMFMYEYVHAIHFIDEMFLCLVVTMNAFQSNHK